MGMIKIKNERFKDLGFSEYELLPVNPYSKYRAVRTKFYGKDILHTFNDQQQAEEVMNYLQQKLHGFIRVTPDKWIKASTIKRYAVYPDVFKIKIYGSQEHTIKIECRDLFDTMVEYLDKSL